MTNETQRELIETEMARLIGELQQLKGVREALNQQTERKTVEYYLMNGGVSGRYFVRSILDDPRRGHAYRILGFKWNNAEIKYHDGSTEDEDLSNLINDLEAPIAST